VIVRLCVFAIELPLSIRQCIRSFLHFFGSDARSSESVVQHTASCLPFAEWCGHSAPRIVFWAWQLTLVYVATHQYRPVDYGNQEYSAIFGFLHQHDKSLAESLDYLITYS